VEGGRAAVTAQQLAAVAAGEAVPQVAVDGLRQHQQRKTLRQQQQQQRQLLVSRRELFPGNKQPPVLAAVWRQVITADTAVPAIDHSRIP
jgi:hypothetical protein